MLDKLILLGVDVRARDHAGCTPLCMMAVASASDLGCSWLGQPLTPVFLFLVLGSALAMSNVLFLSSVMKAQVDLDMVRLLVKYGAGFVKRIYLAG